MRLSLGLLDSAAQLTKQVRTELLSHGHASTVAFATLCAVTWPMLVVGDLEGLERESAALTAYCAEKKVEQIRLLARYHHACVCAMREPDETNIAAHRAALDAVRSAGGLVAGSLHRSNLVEASLMAGDLASAEATLEDGFAFVEQSGERHWLADLHRLCGHVALKRPEPGRLRAEACFVKAMEIARGQDARLLVLRAANDLARLWCDTRSDSDPRALLSSILATIEGGETTRDVRNARAVIAELA